MVTIIRTLNNGQGSRWAQADGKQHNQANSIGQLAWHLSLSTESLAAVVLQVACVHLGSGWVNFACGFFLTYALLELKVLNQVEGG